MTAEDLNEIESAGRRCAMCHTGRRWRQFVVVRQEGRPPVVMCPACNARYGAAPPVPATEQATTAQPAPARAARTAAPAPAAAAPADQPDSAPAAQSAPARAEQPAAARNGKAAGSRDEQDGSSSASKPRSAPREDRLRKALRELPHGEHSVARIAKAAGLNHEKTVRRLQTLHAAGEVQQVGKRWSNEPPSTDIEAAMDRLQARTTNLRIVRDRD
jgi:hypothetical protein